jgi:hypothetical protein
MILKKSMAAIILHFLFIAGYGQKMPKVQEISLRAPANIKIDGKASEWNGKLQAYNTATNLFYTICNDNKNLYLLVQSNDPAVLFKINTSGIVLRINTTQKSDKNAISITYPFYEAGNFPYVNVNTKPKIDKTDESVRLADSVMRSVNKRIDDKAKFIKITGIPDIDTLISVYNDTGIKTVQSYDNALTYTCEMAIPLKYLKLDVNTLPKMYYHIILEPVKQGYLELTIERANKRVTASDRTRQTMPRAGGFSAATDFWGEYILAK